MAYTRYSYAVARNNKQIHTTVNILAMQQPLAHSSPITTDESPTLATYSVSSRTIATLAVVPAVLSLPPLVLGHVSVPH